jgi:hypothetical protein
MTTNCPKGGERISELFTGVVFMEWVIRFRERVKTIFLSDN